MKLSRLLAVVIQVCASVVMATQSAQFNYQARLTDVSGFGLSGSHLLFFGVYAGGDANTVGSGTLLYSESASLSLTNGIVSHAVGTGTKLSANPLSPSMFAVTNSYFLEVAVDSIGNVILPRTQIAPTTYALGADNSERTVHSFPVVPGNTIAAGNVVSLIGGSVQKGFSSDSITSGTGGVPFSNVATTNISVAALSTTKFVVAYANSASSSQGTAVIGTLSAGTISYGSPLVFNTGSTAEMSVTALSPTKFVVAYRDTGTSSAGTAIAGSVSGSTITFGTETPFTATRASNPSITTLDTSRFVVVYSDFANSNQGACFVGTVSGTAITYGSKFLFNPASTGDPVAAAVSASKFVVAFEDGANSNQGMLIVGAVSGTNVTTGAKTMFHAGQTFGQSIAALGSATIVVAFREGTGHGNAIVGTVGASTVTPASAFVFHPANTLSPVIAPLSSNQFAIAYSDNGVAANPAKAVVGTINTGNILSFSPDFVLNALESSALGIAGLSPTLFVSAFSDDVLIKGDAELCEVAANNQILGVAASASDASGNVPVILNGISNVHTGLTAGEILYSKGDGTLTISSGSLPQVGQAISPTEILLKLNRPVQAKQKTLL